MTVAARRVVSSPVRTATETWGVITNILAPKDGTARRELSKIAGVACSLIASEAPTKRCHCDLGQRTSGSGVLPFW